MPRLEVQNLTVHFAVRRGVLGRVTGTVQAVDDVSFWVERGESLGLVGESGCGKTTLGRAVLRLVEPTAGTVRYDGVDLTRLTPAALRPWRRRLQVIFQDPYGSLNPELTVGESLGEALEVHRLAANRQARRARIAGLLECVGLESAHADRYPHEFSGGQRQRIGLARALAVEPELIVCDEPVSALDVCVQAQVVNLLQDLQRNRGLSYLFISHDLAVVEHLCRRTLVMYLGRVVEAGETRRICAAPRHPYTQALVSAVPTLDPGTGRVRRVLGGEVPSPLKPPSGCPFHPRCPVADARCRVERPVLKETAPGWSVACHQVAGAGEG